jgi:hypothetical protein
MKSVFKISGSLILAALTIVACVHAEDTAQPLKKRSVAQKKATALPSVQEQIQALRQALEAQSLQINNQSNEINNLKKDLAEKDVRLQKAEQQATQAQSAADKANAVASSDHQAATENTAAVATLQNSVNTVKANSATLARSLVNETAQLKKERANPTTLYYKGISLSPGGFIAADTVYRSKGIASDIPTSFNNLPYEGDDRYKLSEFYGSARPTRISLLFESKPKWGALRGYYEADFQGVGTNSNNNQTNSYVMRQRVLYGEAEMNSGWKVAFGQMWSLATEGNKGIPSNPSGILTPLTIDTNYMPGFIFTRQYGVRVVKSIAGGKFTLGVSAENPQLMYTASLAGNTPYAVLGSAGSSSGYNAAISSSTATTYVKNYVPAAVNVGSAGYLAVYGTVTANTNIANYSFNAAPDLLVKAVADPGWGHYEIFGLVGFAHETIYPGVTTDSVKYGGQYDVNCPSSVSTCSPVAALSDPSTTVQDSIILGGAGASFRVPVVKNKLSFGAKALYGPGVGRYSGSTLADVTSNAWGGLAPIHNLSGLLTLEWTPSKRLTLWSNYGGDYAARVDYSTTKTTGLSDPTACFGSYDIVDYTCFTAKTVTKSILSDTTGTWGGSWHNNATEQAVGYGSRQAINYYKVNNIAYGCNVTAAPGYNSSSTGYNASSPAYCVGHTRNVQEVTGGYYYDFYKGEYGRLRQGIQYGYAVREGWSGSTDFGVNKGWGAKGIDNMIWTSLRYYLP